ncbi:MAG: 4'-phosphopantetheinyl transferase superfamily protein [Verrucomicrobiota bacterium]
MKSGQVVVHLLVPDAVSPESALAGITHEELIRARQFRFAKDADRWVSFRSQLRVILGQALNLPPLEVPLALSDQGKPLLSPPHDLVHFNLSHCAELGLVAISSDGPTGVDLESLDRRHDLLGCESTFCHPEEIARLPQGETERAIRLLEIWTSKEAVLKALGTGLIHPPETVRVDLADPVGQAVSDSPLEGIENQQIHVLVHPRLVNYRAVVSAVRSVGSIEFI